MTHSGSASLDEGAANPGRPVRRHPGSARLQDAGRQAAAGPVILFLFVASLLIPANIDIAGIVLMPYRLLLMALIVPLFLRLIGDKENPLNIVDCLFAGYIGWMALAVLFNHGPSRIVYIGSAVIDEFGAYLVGRTLIRNAADYRRLFKYFLWALLFMLPFAVLELLTRRNLLYEFVSMFALPNSRAGASQRLGLFRVQASFSHFILFGLFCSIGVANLFCIYRHEFFKRWTATGLAAVMTFMSLSSAPVIAMAIQLGLLTWDRLVRFITGHWFLLGLGGALGFAVLQMALPNGVLGFIIENATFNPETGWGRTEIFAYGSAEVLRNPVFGIGFNDWVRPWWRKESVDNFWLLTAMQFGLPAFLFLFSAVLLNFLRIAARKGLDEEAARYRTGYLVAWVGVIFSLATVDIFGALTPFLMAYIGAGAWFHSASRRDTERGAELPRRESGDASPRQGRPPRRGLPASERPRGSEGPSPRDPGAAARPRPGGSGKAQALDRRSAGGRSRTLSAARARRISEEQGS